VDVSTKQIVGIERRVVEKDGSKKLSKFMTGLFAPGLLKASMPFVVVRQKPPLRASRLKSRIKNPIESP
jgi:hypothetical protein